MSNKDWDSDLSPEQNYILRQEGTESPGSSPLNNEKREGSYHCVGCGTKLFESNTKYESGSGWPSFFKSLPEVFVTPSRVTITCACEMYGKVIENEVVDALPV